MTDTKPINHEEALQYARMHEHDSNLARCYLELAAIKSQPVPVEPDEVTTLIDGSWSELNAAATRKHIDTLQAALQRVREERDKCAQMNDDQSRRVFAAEERVKRMVELMKEPSASMIAAGYPPNDERSQSWDVTEVFKAMSAELLKEAGE